MPAAAVETRLCRDLHQVSQVGGMSGRRVGGEEMLTLRSCRPSFVFGVLSLWCASALAQEPRQVIQRIVDAEYTAYQNDHSDWIYLQETRQSKHDLVQWVAQTEQGEVRRLLEKDDHPVSDSKQQELIRRFLDNPEVRRKQVAQTRHDQELIVNLLRLLPVAFVWTQTNATAATICLHFEPAPHFHPPTREGKVLSEMSGDLIADIGQYRVESVRGHLVHDVTFGGGILGKLQEGSSFSLEQEQVRPSLWQIRSIHVHFHGSAFLFKSIALEEEDDRSQFGLQIPEMTLEQAAEFVMGEPDPGQWRGQATDNSKRIAAANTSTRVK